VSINPSSLTIEGSDRGHVPVQVLFCLKEKNQKKINSHRWFFNAFGPILQPNVCVLIDVGTMPGPTSIYHLWKAFDINSNVGGACGEIVALKGKYGQHLLNPLGMSLNPLPGLYLTPAGSCRSKLRVQDLQHLGQATVRNISIFRPSLLDSCPGNPCSVTSPCFPVPSVPTDTSHFKTTSVVRVLYRSISSVKPW